MRCVLSICLAALVAGPLPSQGADPFQNPTHLKIRSLHDASIAGDRAEVDAAETFIRDVLAADPDNALAQVYLGSLLTIKSSKTWPGPAKLRFLKEGLQLMDQAVDAAPRDPAVRFVRAMNNHELPRFIRRYDNALADFRELFHLLTDPAAATDLQPATRQAIFYYAGVAFEASGESDKAREAWRTGLTLGEQTELGLKITHALRKLKAS